MKRLGIWVATIATLVLVTATAWQIAFPSAAIRYRLTVEARVDGTPATGSGVIEVVYRKNPRLFGASLSMATEVYGDAVPIEAGKKGMLLVLLNGGEDPRFGPQYIVPLAFGVTNVRGKGDFAPIKALEGRRELPVEKLPSLVFLPDPNDPKSVEPVDIRALPRSSEIGIEHAYIDIVDSGVWPFSMGTPITRNLDKRLPWLNDRNAQTEFWRALVSRGYRSSGSVEVGTLFRLGAQWQ